MTLKLPKPYLSYSALNLWTKDKEAFRARYYRGEKLPDTPYLLFGKEVHKKIEESDLAHQVPEYDKSELELSTTVDGIIVLGFIDSFCPESKAFIDYKSGIRKRDGSPRWTELETHKLDQLPFYSMLIEDNYNEFPKEHQSKLVWLETTWTEDNELLSNQMPELELTGHFETFERVIEPWERIRIREWIVEKAGEISEDYSQYISHS